MACPSSYRATRIQAWNIRRSRSPEVSARRRASFMVWYIGVRGLHYWGGCASSRIQAASSVLLGLACPRGFSTLSMIIFLDRNGIGGWILAKYASMKVLAMLLSRAKEYTSASKLKVTSGSRPMEREKRTESRKKTPGNASATSDGAMRSFEVTPLSRPLESVVPISGRLDMPLYKQVRLCLAKKDSH